MTRKLGEFIWLRKYYIDSACGGTHKHKLMKIIVYLIYIVYVRIIIYCQLS